MFLNQARLLSGAFVFTGIVPSFLMCSEFTSSITPLRGQSLMFESISTCCQCVEVVSLHSLLTFCDFSATERVPAHFPHCFLLAHWESVPFYPFSCHAHWGVWNFPLFILLSTIALVCWPHAANSH